MNHFRNQNEVTHSHCSNFFRYGDKSTTLFFYLTVFKEPPYSLKESGYAGFVLPIDIYFKNRDDPKKVTYSYDLNLQNTGTITNVDKTTQLFKNPSEDFRRKLLKGGGFTINNFPNNADEKAREQDERAQLISKPKLGGSELSGKKYKSKSDETKVSNTYANLFGPSGSKGAANKVSPDAKSKSASSTGAKQPQKTEKTPRDKSDKEKKEKNKHNSPNKEKTDARDVSRKPHDDKHEKREEKKKDKTHSKERGRSKDKVPNAKQDPSPKRMTQSPKRISPSRCASAMSKADDNQSVKSFSKQAEPVDRPSSSAKKPKKDKKEKNPDKERDRERAKEQKQKEERPSSKVSDKIDLKKEKDPGNRNQKSKVNDVKQSNPVDHINEASISTPNEKKSEKDPDRKHKHKKKDKNKDKEKEHAKERKKEKSSKYKEDVKMANTSPPKKSEPPQSSQLPQQQAKINPLTTLLNEIDEKASSDSDDDHSKPSISYTQVMPGKLPDTTPKPIDDPQPAKSEKQLEKGEKPPKRAKKEKEAKSSDKEDKKRKRKSKDETPSPAFSEPPLKQSRKEENGALWRTDNFMSTTQNTPPPHRIDSISRSSPLPSAQKSTPSRSSSSMRATPSPLSTNTAAHHQLSPNLQQQQQRQQKDYMSQLKELQHKIMSLEDNNELQQVVEMIIETGNYEITGEKTFDFDLCTLDRTTVQRLQNFWL